LAILNDTCGRLSKYITMPMRHWQRETLIDENEGTTNQIIRVEDWHFERELSNTQNHARAPFEKKKKKKLPFWLIVCLHVPAGTDHVTVTVRTLLIEENGSVTMKLDTTGANQEPEDAYGFSCELGTSAIVHGYGDETTPMYAFTKKKKS
jgi:hypothetical protein